MNKIEVLEFKSQLNFKIGAIQKWIKEKEIPLDDRWDSFIESDFLPIDVDSNGHLHILSPSDDLTLYDDFHCDRYATLTYKGMLEMIGEVYFEHNIKEENLIKWKEAVLQEGNYGFINDW